MFTEKFVSRFWAKTRTTDTGCIVWTASVKDWGYGQVKVGRKMRAAHRVAWEMHAGRPVPEGLVVMHSCDNPACVNARHLSVGTMTENLADMYAKGRGRKALGCANASAKLTESAVRQIRDMAARGIPQQQIGTRFNVTQTAVSAVVRRQTWHHVVP